MMLSVRIGTEVTGWCGELCWPIVAQLYTRGEHSLASRLHARLIVICQRRLFSRHEVYDLDAEQERHLLENISNFAPCLIFKMFSVFSRLLSLEVRLR
jgi:hypothetical protein